jgi:hypothetical protein
VGKIKISGTKNKHNKSSCRNALSSLIAKLNPEMLFTKARKSLFNPVFCL